MRKTNKKVYKARAANLFEPDGLDKDFYHLTLEKPDDVDEPCGELVEVNGRIVYAPYGPGGFFYLSPFSGRWE